MSTITIPGQKSRGSHTLFKRVFGVLRNSTVRVFSPHRASLVKLADIPLTVAGAGCVAAGVFLASTIAGLVILGGVLILLEYLIADDAQ